MSTQPRVLDLPEQTFRHQSFEIISREHGLAGSARFLRAFCSVSGDYTAERQQWLGHLTLDDIWRDLEAQNAVPKP